MNDREQIQEVIARYAKYIDAKDYDGIIACFMTDATFTYEGHAMIGRPAIVNLIKTAVEPLDGTQHLFANFIVCIEGDRARLTCDCLGQHWRNAAAGSDKFLVGAKYSVQLERADDGNWKISGGLAHAVWSDGNPSILSGYR
jgi:ketosteroid isomerase-like protein